MFVRISKCNPALLKLWCDIAVSLVKTIPQKRIKKHIIYITVTLNPTFIFSSRDVVFSHFTLNTKYVTYFTLKLSAYAFLT